MCDETDTLIVMVIDTVIVKAVVIVIVIVIVTVIVDNMLIASITDIYSNIDYCLHIDSDTNSWCINIFHFSDNFTV